MLRFDFPKEYQPLLKIQGADPKILYNSKERFDLEESLIPVKSSIPYMKASTIGVQKQMLSAERLLADPTKGHPVAIINSLPTDTRAKLFGLNLMFNAIKLNDQDRERNPRIPKRHPLWITMYNHTFDIQKFRQQRPSMLIISNVNIESSSNKLDRLRDLLEFYADLPRYVVMGGTDPFKFMYTKLFLSMNHVVNLGSKNVSKQAMELLCE